MSDTQASKRDKVGTDLHTIVTQARSLLDSAVGPKAAVKSLHLIFATATTTNEQVGKWSMIMARVGLSITATVASEFSCLTADLSENQSVDPLQHMTKAHEEKVEQTHKELMTRFAGVVSDARGIFDLVLAQLDIIAQFSTNSASEYFLAITPEEIQSIKTELQSGLQYVTWDEATTFHEPHPHH